MRDFKDLIAQMSIEEKIGQLIQLSANFFGTDTELTGPAQSWGLTKEQLATIGSCIGGKDAKTIRAIQEEHLRCDRNKIPLIFMSDIIHGYRTVYPIGLGLVGSFDAELVRECTEMAAKEASAAGLHLTFAPMVDVARDARWGRVMESCGEDTYLATVMGAEQVRAFQGDNPASADHIGACVKHFAAYGACEAGRDYNTVEISERALRQYYLPPYRACIDAGVQLLMPSFNNLNGTPSIANSFLMKKILKDEWNYNGAVISDWAAIAELCVHGVAENMKDAARLAFENGCNIEMVSKGYYLHLAELVNEGVISEKSVDEAVLSVLRLKDSLGLFDDPFHGASDERAKSLCLSGEHRAIARRAAEEMAVLLKNDGVLPFSRDVKKVAIIGPYAAEEGILGPWAPFGRKEDCVTVEQGVGSLLKGAEVRTAQGCGMTLRDTDKSGFVEALELAKWADVVILCVGEPMNYSGEGNCRTDISLPGVQSDLVCEVCGVNKNSAVVLFNGRPLVLTDIFADAPAILETWFPGSEGGNAIADLLFGVVNPSGKLAMSFPKSVGQCPIYYNRTNTGRPKTVAEEDFRPFVSSYIDCGNLPLFFFGEGLSYTSFKYEKIELSHEEITDKDTLTVSVTVKNSGDRQGKEVVQLYIRDKVCSVVRPVQELIAFKKILLDAGESIKVEFEITEPMLRFYDSENRYISEAGEFDLFVGYADHVALKTSFRLVK